MLLELEVQGFALVDRAVLEFGPGLTVLSGETGAGKSIVLDSLGFLLACAPFAGADDRDCRVAGRFRPTKAANDYLEEQGLPGDPSELLIVRERRLGGRTTSRLNGGLVTAAQLKGLAPYLVDLHGQHQSYRLTRESSHLATLDRLAGDGHLALLDTYQQQYRKAAGLQQEIDSLHMAERERLRELDLIERELQEIEAAGLEDPDEDRLLEARIAKLAASTELAAGCQTASDALRGDRGALDRLALAISALGQLVRHDPSLKPPLERLMELEVELAECGRDLSIYGETVERDEGALDRLQARAEELKKLKRRYGSDLREVLSYAVELVERRDRLLNSSEHLQRLEGELAQATATLERSATELSTERVRAARELETEVVRELQGLALPGVEFTVELKALPAPAFQGAEEARFLFRPNPGRPPAPLAETASGGELSRVMLALVSLLSRHQRQPTLIFDEIDAGLGGRAAEAVADRLRELSRRVQVLCVTHLPVVAAAGEVQFRVQKSTGQGRAVVLVESLDQDQRVEELARMLSGESAVEASRQLAVGLLAASGAVRTAHTPATC